MTDRSIVYPGELPRTLDFLSAQQWLGIGLGYLAQAVLGTATWVDGLACTPTSPATMQVIVAPGAIGTLTVVEQTAYGGVAADTTDPLVKVGINIASNTFTITAPGTVGQSQNYLIAAAFSETDTTPIVLPYYNAANPQQPFQGPANSGAPQNTQRIQRVALQLVAGVPAATGSQTTPATPVGYVPLWVITVAQGQTTITSGNIVQATSAPFIPYKLPLVPVSGRLLNVRIFTAGTYTYTPTSGTNAVTIDLVGAGGGSGGCAATGPSHAAASGGGAGGAFARSRLTSGFAGQTLIVGAGGAGGASGANAGIGGGNSTFGSIITCPGGNGSGGGASGTTPPIIVQGGNASLATGGNILSLLGEGGGPAWLLGFSTAGQVMAGWGGGNMLSPHTGPQTFTTATPGQDPGGGAAGCGNLQNGSAKAGAAGADGIAIIAEYS